LDEFSADEEAGQAKAEVATAKAILDLTPGRGEILALSMKIVNKILFHHEGHEDHEEEQKIVLVFLHAPSVLHGG
jgi:hypothetical protein